ncbi:MAG: hypothetical protein EBE86_035080 [Hormoscilla sp. GUM202]|nr:hypothetical protein [Hormoscilla sp. GUM202]
MVDSDTLSQSIRNVTEQISILCHAETLELEQLGVIDSLLKKRRLLLESLHIESDDAQGLYRYLQEVDSENVNRLADEKILAKNALLKNQEGRNAVSAYKNIAKF